MLKIILLALSLFFGVFAKTANAAVTVEIRDTTIKSDCISIPITGTTADFKGKKVEYGFEVNWVNFEILGIVTQPNYALNDESEYFSYSYNHETRILTVTSENFSSSFTGTLFEINIRLLPRMDFFMTWENVFQIAPKYVAITSTSSQETDTINFVSSAASIFIDTINANQTFKEGVSLNYPNPFNYETVIFFSIDEPTPVKMELYNFSGSVLQKIPENVDGALYFHFYDAFNNEIEVSDNYEFSKGLYKVILRINRAVLATGQYRLLVKTNQNRKLINLSFAN